jgi:hypothetical protein
MERVIENQWFKYIQVSKIVYPIFKSFYIYVFVKNGIKCIEYQCKCLKNATQNIILCLKVLHFGLYPFIIVSLQGEVWWGKNALPLGGGMVGHPGAFGRDYSNCGGSRKVDKS